MRNVTDASGPSGAGKLPSLPPAGRRAPVSPLLVLLFLGAALAACARSERLAEPRLGRGDIDPKTGVSASARIIGPGDPVPKGGGTYKLGSPYKVSERWYVPQEDPGYDRAGIASWYGADFHGRRTANGEIFDMDALAAAHPTLPLPSYAYVTNLENGRTILVRVNDRGPYVADRLIDLSRRSAHELGLHGAGLGRVRVRYGGRAPLDGGDHHERQFLAAQSWHSGDRRLTTSAAPLPWTRPPAESGWSAEAYRAGRLGERRSPVPPGRQAKRDWGRSYVNVGLFRNRGQVDRLRHELAGFGPVEVDAMTQGAEPVYRVRVGPFSEPAAGDVLRRVRYAGLPSDGIVRD